MFPSKGLDIREILPKKNAPEAGLELEFLFSGEILAVFDVPLANSVLSNVIYIYI